MKKLLILFLTLFSIGILNIQTVSGKTLGEKELKQSELLSEYSKFMKKSSSYVDFDDEYGGAYFDDFGNLVLNVVADKKVKFMKNNTLNEKFEVKEVKYSLKEINKSIKEVEKLIKIGVIESVARSEMDNTLIVTMGENSSENKKVVKSIAKLDNIIFEESVIGIEATFTTNYVTNGTSASISLNYPNQDSSTSVTIGFAARNSSGDAGFVTTGHGDIGTGNNVNCEEYFWNCGDVRQIQYEDYSHSDAAFVELRTPFIGYNYKPTLDFMNGDSYEDVTQIDSLELWDLFIQNSTIYAYGAESGKQPGKILATYYSDEVGGIQLNGFVKCDYIAVLGDSGAAVTFFRNSDRMVMGLQSYSGLDDVYHTYWVTGKSYSCFSTVTNIFNDLNLSFY